MVYACTQCGFIFERHGEVETCPKCGSHKIRHSNEDENAVFNSGKTRKTEKPHLD